MWGMWLLKGLFAYWPLSSPQRGAPPICVICGDELHTYYPLLAGLYQTSCGCSSILRQLLRVLLNVKRLHCPVYKHVEKPKNVLVNQLIKKNITDPQNVSLFWFNSSVVAML